VCSGSVSRHCGRVVTVGLRRLPGRVLLSCRCHGVNCVRQRLVLLPDELHRPDGSGRGLLLDRNNWATKWPSGMSSGIVLHGQRHSDWVPDRTIRINRSGVIHVMIVGSDFRSYASCVTHFLSSEGLSNGNCSGVCNDGVLCEEGSTSVDGVPCPAGSYCVAGLQTLCPAGRYNADQGSSSVEDCRACRARTYNSLTGRSSDTWCTVCAPFEGSSEGSSTCWPGVIGRHRIAVARWLLICVCQCR
jgi:hypothetical protein